MIYTLLTAIADNLVCVILMTWLTFLFWWLMPYIVRDESGKISKVSVRPVPGAEMLPHDHKEVITFMEDRGVPTALIAEALGELRRTDNEMSRAVEDVITALLKKNILKMSDLPKAVQDRISYRVKMRVQIQESYDRASSQTGRGSQG